MTTLLSYIKLSRLIEKQKTILDEKGFCGAVLMDLSKSFDTINYEGFEKSALKMLLNYLSNRWQRTKINKTLCSWVELMQGVTQGSV